jgi:hypothetical protein
MRVVKLVEAEQDGDVLGNPVEISVKLPVTILSGDVVFSIQIIGIYSMLEFLTLCSINSIREERQVGHGGLVYPSILNSFRFWIARTCPCPAASMLLALQVNYHDNLPVLLEPSNGLCSLSKAVLTPPE